MVHRAFEGSGVKAGEKLRDKVKRTLGLREVNERLSWAFSELSEDPREVTSCAR